jgi:hypothetical protein
MVVVLCVVERYFRRESVRMSNVSVLSQRRQKSVRPKNLEHGHGHFQW